MLQEAPPHFERILGARNWKIFTESDGFSDYRSAVLLYPSDIAVSPIKIEKLMVSVKLNISGKEILVTSLHVPPQDDIEHYTSQLTSLIAQIPETIIGGDWNCRSTLWGDKIENARGKKLKEWLEDSNLIICSNSQGPTFRAVRNETICESAVDMIVSTVDIAAKSSDISHLVELNLSDHLPLAITMKSKVNHMKKITSTRTYLKEQSPESYEEFKNCLERQVSTIPRNSLNTRCFLEEFTRRIHNAASGNFKKLKPSNSKPNLPWWDEEIQATVTALKRVKKFIKNGSEASKLRKAKLVDTLKSTLKKQIEKKKKHFFRKEFTVSAPSQVWDKFYSKLSRSVDPRDIYIMENGRRIDDQREILDRLGKKFFSFDDPRLDNEDHKVIRENFEKEYTSNLDTDEILPTKEELETAIRSFSSGKAPGQDGITHEMLSSMGDKAISAMHELIVAIWKDGEYPKEWKTAIIKFLRKPGGEKGTLKQFRPIGLLSCCSKIMERIMHSRIEWSRRKNLDSLVFKRQYGFTLGRSAEDALYDLINFIREKKKSGKKVIKVSIDIMSAFDTAWWPLILHRLKKMKVEKAIIKLVKSYFTDRRVEMHLGESKLAIEQTKGCIQGSVLGPLFWNLIVDELFERCAVSNTRIQAYADDICIVGYGNSYEEAAKSIQSVMNQIEKWAIYCKLQVSPEKSSLIAFSKQKATKDFTVKLCGREIQEVYSTRVLGLEIDKNLTWIPHFNKQAKKISTMYQRLAPLVTRAYGPSPEAMRLVIEGAMFPKLLYGSPIFKDSVEKPTIKKLLKKIHRQWLIRSYRLFCSTSYVKSLIVTSSRSILEQVKVRSEVLKMKREREIRINPFDRKTIDIRRPKPELPPHIKRKIEVQIADGTPTVDDRETVAYTDGSKIQGKVGAAFIVRNCRNELERKKLKLADWCSVFQAETCAVYHALKSIKEKNSESKIIRICSDSTSTLLAIRGDKRTSEIVWKTRQLAWELIEKGYRIIFQWVRAHVGHDLNEQVDQLAKEAALDDCENLDYNHLPFSSEKRRIMTSSELRQNQWLRSQGCELLNRFGTALWNKNIYGLSLSKEMMWYLTNHGPTRAALKRLQIGPTDMCPCGLAVQNMQHLSDCPILDPLWRRNGEMSMLFKTSKKEFICKYSKNKIPVDEFMIELFDRVKIMNRQST